jgi:biotin carboxylase
MLAKVMAQAPTRALAILRLREALKSFAIRAQNPTWPRLRPC